MNLLLRVLAAAGLAVDGYVHFDLATTYDAVGSTLTQGTLFRVQAGAAVLAALLILLIRRTPIGRIWVYAVVFLVAASALVPVLLYTYVDVGSLGPLPNMYEPAWYPDKTLSAIGEAVAIVAAGSLLALTLRSRSASPTSTATGKGR